MKLLAVGALVAVLLAGGAEAATAPATTKTVTVGGTGTVDAVPDQASFSFTVQTKAAK